MDTSKGKDRVISDLSRSSGVSEEQVTKVLEQLGLERLANELGNVGVDMGSVGKENLYLAARPSKNTVIV
jgi:hypothetical protein